jgi:hypothetical protein
MNDTPAGQSWRTTRAWSWTSKKNGRAQSCRAVRVYVLGHASRYPHGPEVRHDRPPPFRSSSEKRCDKSHIPSNSRACGGALLKRSFHRRWSKILVQAREESMSSPRTMNSPLRTARTRGDFLFLGRTKRWLTDCQVWEMERLGRETVSYLPLIRLTRLNSVFCRAAERYAEDTPETRRARRVRGWGPHVRYSH